FASPHQWRLPKTPRGKTRAPSAERSARASRAPQSRQLGWSAVRELPPTSSCASKCSPLACQWYQRYKPKTPDHWSKSRQYACRRHRQAKSDRSEEHTSELQSRFDLVCRLLLEKKN